MDFSRRRIRPSIRGSWRDSGALPRSKRPAAPRRVRAIGAMVEALEQRVVLSDWGGGNLLGSALNSIGVVTGPVVVPAQSTSSGQVSQLETDIQALQKELAGLAASSGLTVADLTALASDSQAIAQAGARVDVKALDSAVNELATALTAGTSTTQAQTDFQAVFANTSVPAATVTQAFNDLTTAIKASGITSTDLATVAKDQAAIQTDLANLHKGGDGDSDDSGGTDTSSSGSGSSSGSSPTGNGCGSSNGGSSSGDGASSGSGSTGTTSIGVGSTTTGSGTPPSPTALTATDSSPTISTGTATGSSTSTTGTATPTTKGHHHGHHSGSSLAVTHAAHTHARLRRG